MASLDILRHGQEKEAIVFQVALFAIAQSLQRNLVISQNYGCEDKWGSLLESYYRPDFGKVSSHKIIFCSAEVTALHSDHRFEIAFQ